MSYEKCCMELPQCRRQGFLASMKNLCCEFKPDLVVLLEPRIGGRRVRRIISLGFDKCEIEEARGFTGGIWIMWKGHSIDVCIVNKNEQFIHCYIGKEQEDGWFLMRYMHAHERRDGCLCRMV